MKEARREVIEVNEKTNFKDHSSKKLRSKFKEFEEEDQKITYGVLHKRLTGENKTHRSQKIKNHSVDIHNPLLNIIGCHEEDALLDKYFYQERMVHKSQDRNSYR